MLVHRIAVPWKGLRHSFHQLPRAPGGYFKRLALIEMLVLEELRGQPRGSWFGKSGRVRG